MKYLQWNNAIGKWLFNEEKAEEEVYLFVTKQDIICIGRVNGLNLSDEDIFLDFINALRIGIPGNPKHGNLLENAMYAYSKWSKCFVSIDGVPVEYPLYIGYLILFVLPLIEDESISSRTISYYPPLRNFLAKYNLPLLPNQNEGFNWNLLWQDLEEWSILKKNTELGFFELHPFSNVNWVYVGKPLSQCIFSPNDIKALPALFASSGLVPGEELDDAKIRDILQSSGKKYLNLSSKIYKAITDTDNELGQSILNLVRRNYQNWAGNTDFYESDEEKVRKGYTIAPLRLCLEGDKAKGYRTYFRLYTKLDLPEDLIFSYNQKDYKCQEFANGWSKSLVLPLIGGLEIQDKFNKWKGRFPDKDIRLLIDGRNFHMSGWVEVPYMIASKMLILAKDEKSASIETWGKCFSEGDFVKVPIPGIKGYVLYEIANPPVSHPEIKLLQFKSNKKLLIHKGIKVGVRSWLIDLLPEVELENGCGNEELYLTYEGCDNMFPLIRKHTDQPIWLLPSDIRIDTGFYIKVHNDSIKGDQLKNFIVDSSGKENDLSEAALPARDKFGQITSLEKGSTYMIGSRLLAEDEITDKKLSLKQVPYIPAFKPLETSDSNAIFLSNESTLCNDKILTYLTFKGESSAKEYFDIFESIFQNEFDPEEIESHTIELSKLKRWSLSYLDYMGILDYEYSMRKIVVNPPQFILIPTTKGRKALLIGGRTPELLKKIQKNAKNEGLIVTIEPQDLSLAPFLLPAAVTVACFGECTGHELEKRIQNLADSCSIYFDSTKLPQFRLVEFSGTLFDYVNQLMPDESFDDSGWPARTFDINELRFTPVSNENINKTFSLIEYRLTEYSFKHKLWKDGISYTIDKNWGRYLVLNHYKKNIIFNDRDKNIVAIPAALPLPRLISEAMTLFSGKAPKREYLEVEGIKAWYNIYQNIPPIFGYNYFMKVGQKQHETTIKA